MLFTSGGSSSDGGRYEMRFWMNYFYGFSLIIIYTPRFLATSYRILLNMRFLQIFSSLMGLRQNGHSLFLIIISLTQYKQQLC
jgi:hypothetical protein